MPAFTPDDVHIIESVKPFAGEFGGPRSELAAVHLLLACQRKGEWCPISITDVSDLLLDAEADGPNWLLEALELIGNDVNYDALINDGLVEWVGPAHRGRLRPLRFTEAGLEVMSRCLDSNEEDARVEQDSRRSPASVECDTCGSELLFYLGPGEHYAGPGEIIYCDAVIDDEGCDGDAQVDVSAWVNLVDELVSAVRGAEEERDVARRLYCEAEAVGDPKAFADEQGWHYLYSDDGALEDEDDD